MGDYLCIHCQDRGNCNNCSWFFESDEYHNACGFRWGAHKSYNHSAYHECPKPKHRAEGPAQ